MLPSVSPSHQPLAPNGVRRSGCNLTRLCPLWSGGRNLKGSRDEARGAPRSVDWLFRWSLWWKKMRHEDVVCVMVYVSNYVCSPVPHPATKKFNHLIKKKTVAFKLPHVDVIAKPQLVLWMLSVLAFRSYFGTTACRGANHIQLMIYYRSTCLQQIYSLTQPASRHLFSYMTLPQTSAYVCLLSEGVWKRGVFVVRSQSLRSLQLLITQISRKSYSQTCVCACVRARACVAVCALAATRG